MAKTASYTKKAIDDYRKKHDFINLTVEKGLKDRLAAAGIKNSDIIELINTELKKRESSGGG